MDPCIFHIFEKDPNVSNFIKIIQIFQLDNKETVLFWKETDFVGVQCNLFSSLVLVSLFRVTVSV